MPAVSLTYKIDLGDLGQRDVKVHAQVITGLTGKLMLDVERVMINVHGVETDIAPFISVSRMLAICEALKHQYWAEMLRGREAVGETAL